MSYQGDFWLAVATPAPIIALANTVTMTSTLPIALARYRHLHGHGLQAFSAAHAMRVAPFFRSYVVATLNFILQAFALVLALAALAQKRDGISMWIVIVIEGLGMFALFYQLIIAGNLRFEDELDVLTAREHAALGGAAGGAESAQP